MGTKKGQTMIKTNEQQLKDLFTMENEEICEIIDNLEIDALDVMQTIVKFTSNKQDFKKVDEFSKLVYVTREAYRQGFMAALYYYSKVNKDSINALTNNKDATIA